MYFLQAADNIRASFQSGMVDIKNPIYGYAENVNELYKNFYLQKGKERVEARGAFVHQFKKARLARTYTLSKGAGGAPGGAGVHVLLPGGGEKVDAGIGGSDTAETEEVKR